jgi:hypothetical protein
MDPSGNIDNRTDSIKIKTEHTSFVVLKMFSPSY